MRIMLPEERSPHEDEGLMTAEPQRLSKVVAALVPCSRREAEQYITEGWVRVDGQCIEEPQARVADTQRVELDPQARLQAGTLATMLVHKPAGLRNEDAQRLLEPKNRWAGDTSGLRLVRRHASGLRLLLPIPREASGLAVFSQDGRIVRKLTEDAGLIEQELVAEVAGTIAADGLARLNRGMSRDGRPLPPMRVSWQSEARLRFAVKGSAAEAIEWMCAQVGLQLLALKRLRIGRIPMAGLPAGQWRFLAPDERF
jgi:23S rRNA pseudouridine2604 synthase